MKLSLLQLNKQTIVLFAIIIFGAALRFYQINRIPLGFYWDEAAITYNSWSLAVWHRDEFGNRIPLSFKSFGDYKAPLLIYILGFIYKISGLHPEYLRILVAGLGVLNIYLIYLISLTLLPRHYFFANITALLMAISPWVVHFSRIGSEAVLALSLIMLAILALLRSPSNPRWLYVSGISFALSLYAYHSAKIFVPLIIIAWYIYLKPSIKKISGKSLILSLGLFCLLLIPFIYDNFWGDGFERGKSLIFFTEGQLSAPLNFLKLLWQNSISYLSPSFWFGGRDYVGLRHAVPGHGVIFYSVGLFGLLGLVFRGSLSRRQHLFLCAWFFIGLLPAILTHGNPHAIRALLGLPALLVLAANAFSFTYLKLTHRSRPLSISYLIVFALFLSIEILLYLKTYYGAYPALSASAFQYGYKEAILYAKSLEDHGQKTIFTNAYGQPYIYTLLYRQITPEAFKFGALQNYEFRPITWPENHPDRIYIASPLEIPISDPTVVKVIYIPGTTIPVFIIAKS